MAQLLTSLLALVGFCYLMSATAPIGRVEGFVCRSNETVKVIDSWYSCSSNGPKEPSFFNNGTSGVKQCVATKIFVNVTHNPEGWINVSELQIITGEGNGQGQFSIDVAIYAVKSGLDGPDLDNDPEIAASSFNYQNLNTLNQLAITDARPLPPGMHWLTYCHTQGGNPDHYASPSTTTGQGCQIAVGDAFSAEIQKDWVRTLDGGATWQTLAFDDGYVYPEFALVGCTAPFQTPTPTPTPVPPPPRCAAPVRLLFANDGNFAASETYTSQLNAGTQYAQGFGFFPTTDEPGYWIESVTTYLSAAYIDIPPTAATLHLYASGEDYLAGPQGQIFTIGATGNISSVERDVPMTIYAPSISSDDAVVVKNNTYYFLVIRAVASALDISDKVVADQVRSGQLPGALNGRGGLINDDNGDNTWDVRGLALQTGLQFAFRITGCPLTPDSVAVVPTPVPGTVPSIKFTVDGDPAGFIDEELRELLAKYGDLIKSLISFRFTNRRSYTFIADFDQTTDAQRAKIKAIPEDQAKLDEIADTLGLAPGTVTAVYSAPDDGDGDGGDGDGGDGDSSAASVLLPSPRFILF